MSAKIFPPGVPKSKRVLDLILTIIGGAILSPIILISAIIFRIFHGNSFLFLQTRPGYQGEFFTLYKFRTMRDARDKSGNLLPDSQRITSLGRIMRATSLDEFPELYNVLRGEMSLVGPRPLLVQYLDRYSQEQNRRHDVLPGITGWAQINGRNNVSWEDKFELDTWYVDHWSLWLDLKILLTTPWKVLIREGINQPGNATSREFMGSKDQN